MKFDWSNPDHWTVAILLGVAVLCYTFISLAMAEWCGPWSPLVLWLVVGPWLLRGR